MSVTGDAAEPTVHDLCWCAAAGESTGDVDIRLEDGN
jgi:hypothetical protein